MAARSGRKQAPQRPSRSTSGAGRGAERRRQAVRSREEPGQVAAQGQRHRRVAGGSGATARDVALLRGDGEPSPGHLAGEAEGVEHAGLVAGEPRGEDLPLPGARRRMEPLELADDLGEAARSVEPRARRGVLPAEEEAHQVGAGDGLDLAAQAPQREPVDAGQQSPVAPVGARLAAGQERAAEQDPLRLEAVERGHGERQGKAEAGRDRGCGDRTEPRHPAAKRPRCRHVGRRGKVLAGEPRKRWFERRGVDPRLRREHAPGAGPLRRHPGLPPAQPRPRRTPTGEERVEEPAEGRALRRGQEPHVEEQVVQLVGVAGTGARLLHHLGDRLRGERADAGGVGRGQRSPQHHRPGPPLLERGVVEERPGLRPQDLVGQRRGLGQVACQEAHLAGLDAPEEPFQPRRVHGLSQAVAQGLLDERVVGRLDRPGVLVGVVLAGHRQGEDRGEQVVGAHAGDGRRHLATAQHPRERQRAGGVPAPADGEHGGLERRLREHLARCVPRRASRRSTRAGRSAAARATAARRRRWRRPAARSRRRGRSACGARARGRGSGGRRTGRGARAACRPTRRRSARRRASPGWARRESTRARRGEVVDRLARARPPAGSPRRRATRRRRRDRRAAARDRREAARPPPRGPRSSPAPRRARRGCPGPRRRRPRPGPRPTRCAGCARRCCRAGRRRRPCSPPRSPRPPARPPGLRAPPPPGTGRCRGWRRPR